MLNNATIDKLLIMKLKVMADAYIVQEQDSSYRDISFSERFAMMVDAQYNQRQNNRIFHKVDGFMKGRYNHRQFFMEKPA